MGVSTPLHWASQYDHPEVLVALLLLDRGTCPNDKDRNGQTPLGRLYACTSFQAFEDNAKAIQVFLERWSVLMTVLMLRELRVFHLGNIDIDVAMMDLF